MNIIAMRDRVHFAIDWVGDYRAEPLADDVVELLAVWTVCLWLCSKDGAQ